MYLLGINQYPTLQNAGMTYQTISGCSILELEHSEKGKSVFKNQTHDTKDGALLIQYCWPASERLYGLL